VRHVAPYEPDGTVAKRSTKAFRKESELLGKRLVILEEIRWRELAAACELVMKADARSPVENEAASFPMSDQRQVASIERFEIRLQDGEEPACRRDEPIEEVRMVLAAVLPELKGCLTARAKADELSDDGFSGRRRL
jgi:hypothetical protein